MRDAVINVAAIIAISLAGSVTAGSCKAAKLCCHGRDSACVIQKASPNAIIEGPRDKPCYCDHACLKLGDCCDDFKETCGVVDCTVTEWSEWSACNSNCGTGLQTRTRMVLHVEENGGKHCPQLKESRSCQSLITCHRRSQVPRFKDVALLLPALSESYRENAVDKVTEGHCAVFSIIRASTACGKDDSFAALREGSRICVRCRGEHESTPCHTDKHLVEVREIGRWKMVVSFPMHCHGKWVRVPQIGTNCNATECKNNPPYVFI